MEFEYEALPQRIRFGRGSSTSQVGAEVDALGLKALILISGHGSPAVGAVRSALGSRVVTEFADARQHVPAELAAELREHAAKFPLDGIVSVGGGSTTGAAKILALSTGLPILAIPTTFAGSEVTPIWGMTTNGEKRTGRDPIVQPRTVLYDPDLVASLPRETAVASALNAMAHCVDGLWAPGANPVSATLASEGIHILASGLRASASGASDAATDRLLYGSYLAGTAFAATGSGLHHKLCHALGGAFDLPHAELHAVMLPVVVAFVAPYAPAEVARVAHALGTDDAVAGLRDLYTLVGAPSSLRQLGMRDGDRARALEVLVTRLPMSSPRPVDREAVAALLAAALETEASA